MIQDTFMLVLAIKMMINNTAEVWVGRGMILCKDDNVGFGGIIGAD